MKEFDMPLFDIKSSSGYIAVCGGGGKEDYGVENGLTILSEGLDTLDFYKTEDILKEIAIYSLGSNAGDAMLGIEEKEDLSKDGIIIAAIGQNYFYLFKFVTEKIELLSKVKCEVKKMIFNKHLILLADGNIYGFYDIENNYDLKIETPKEIVSNDEYVFDIREKDKKIVFENISSGFDNFFVDDNHLHKVTSYEKEKRFVFDDSKNSIEEKISKIFCLGGNLIYYTTQKQGSLLNVNGETELLPKITDLLVAGNIMAVSTVTGEIFVYENGIRVNQMSVADLPITGLCFVGEKINFTVLNGVLGSMKIKKTKSMEKILLLSLIFLLITLCAKIFLKNK